MTVDARAATTNLSTLQRAIVTAVAYSDVFDFPVTAEEIRSVLPLAAMPVDVEAALAEDALSAHLSVTGGYHTLRGREALVDLRLRREASSQRLQRGAKHYGGWIARLPFVRMVALTGSLAVNNADEDDDIDYLIVTAAGRVWLARAMTMLVVRFAALRGVTLCPNYLLSETALALPQHDVYTARELMQMRPIAGGAVHARMLAANAWCRDLLPNWQPGPEVSQSTPRPLLTRWGEWLLGGRLGDALERWVFARKGGELRRQAGGNTEAVFDETMCKGHFDAHAARLHDELARRLRRLGVQP
jgi:hypothetical protein